MEFIFLFLMIVVYFLNGKNYFAKPVNYILFFSFFFIFSKIVILNFFNVGFLLNTDIELIRESIFYFSLYIFIACVLSRVQFFKKKIILIPRKSFSNEIVVRSFAPLAILMIVSLLYISALFKGFNPFHNPLLFRQHTQLQGMMYLTLMLYFFSSFYFSYIPYKVLSLKSKLSFVEIFTYFVLLIFTFTCGLTSMFIQFLIAPLLFYNICYRKAIFKYIILIAPPILFFTLIFTKYRDSIYIAGSSESLFSIATSYFSDIKNLILKVVLRFDYLEMYALGYEYTLLSQNFLHSITSFIFQPIPRYFYENKPLNFSTFMSEKIVPTNMQNNVTANFNSLNEFFLNFGFLFGFLIAVFSLTIIIKIATKSFNDSYHNPYNAFKYLLIFFPFIQIGFMAGFLNDLALPVLIINLILFKIFFKRQLK